MCACVSVQFHWRERGKEKPIVVNLVKGVTDGVHSRKHYVCFKTVFLNPPNKSNLSPPLFKDINKMERENRKRTTRDEEEEREQIESKKQECITPPSNYEFREGIGIFDFPWLKDGAIFGDQFPPLDEAFAPNFESFVEEEVCVSPPGAEAEENFCGDDSFWSLLVDVDREQIDCIWSCVIDQPLDIGFNKL